METEALITKLTKIIQRDSGSEVKIVAQTFYGLGLHESVDVMVFKREHSDHAWKLCNELPHPDWKTMPVADYMKFGRSEVLQTVSPGEIMSVTSRLGKPMSCLN